MAKKPLEVDMCAGSALRDTQGEMLSVEGADISELQRINDNHGKGFFNSIGTITSSKKIFKEEDCENDRQKYYWNKIKAPYIYARGFLHDDEDHPNAKAAAAILRNIHKHDSPLKLKASVEGGVLARGIADPSLLARTKIHSIALTFVPANNATLVEPISLDKSSHDEATDMALIKSVIHLAQNNVPSFRQIVRNASATKVHDNLNKIAHLMSQVHGSDHAIEVPSKEVILKSSLESKINNNLEQIHEILDKGIKQALLGATMGAAAMTGGQPSQAKQITEGSAQVRPSNKIDTASHEAAYKNISKKHPILGAIGMIESSGGKNLVHETINNKNSMHHGHTAGGMFGMMPNTATFVLKRDPALAKKYPDAVKWAGDIKGNHAKFTELFNSNPDAAADFAVSLMGHNKAKTKNKEMLVHSWLNGLKGTWNKYKNNGMDSISVHPYVQKVMQEYNKSNPAKAESKDLSKALMAGYGGAGAPMSRTGGAVMQTESFSPGKGFKYATCDKCGKEQIYSKFQVKCRHCGSSFSLEKLCRTMEDLKVKK